MMEVAGSQQSLAKAEDARQEEVLAAYAQFLNSLTFPFQLVVQVHPVDLAWYVMRVEERARSLPPALVAIARDHAAFVQSLTRQRTLLERRTYVVVPWSAAAEFGRCKECRCPMAPAASDDAARHIRRRSAIPRRDNQSTTY